VIKGDKIKKIYKSDRAIKNKKAIEERVEQ